MSDLSPDRPRALGATPGHLLALIRSRQAWTRQQLLDTTGMSRPTLLERLLPLFNAGLIRNSGTTTSAGGRPAQLIGFDDRHMVVLTFDVGHTHGRISVTGVHGHELRSALCPLDIVESEPDKVLGTLITLAGKLMSEGSAERLLGIGVGLPGPISPRTGLPGSTTVMRRWTGYPVLDRIRARWHVPLVLENDARALTLGEAGGPGTGSLLGVKWSSGIGAGLAVDGRSLAGDDGAAGDIGHIRAGASGPECRCGRRGCLAAYASGHALLIQLRPKGVRSLEELAVLSRVGDGSVVPALAAAADRVGTVLASLVALVNPGTVVLGGVIGALPQVVTRVDARIRDLTQPYSTTELRVVPSRLGERAGTVGLVRLVTEQVLAPDAVNLTLQR